MLYYIKHYVLFRIEFYMRGFIFTYMDKQTLSYLIEQSQNGSRKAMEQLITFAHTSVFWQCCRLLNDRQLAAEMTERILKALVSQIDRIQGADHFYKWLGNVTASRCMRMRGQLALKDYAPDSQDMSFPSNELSKAETAKVVQVLADSLPEEHRICFILSACCRVNTKTIAQLSGFTEEVVTKYIAEAELWIRNQMQIYQNRGVAFAGTLAIPVLLRAAMYGNHNRTAAVAFVNKVLPPVPATPVKVPNRSNNTVKILLCAVIALVLLLVLLICGVMILKNTSQLEETTLPSTIATTLPTEVTVADITEPTTQATTVPTTEATTEATTVPETTEAEETIAETEVPETTAPKSSYTPPANTGGTSNGNTPKPTTDPNYNPGQGEDGHTHNFFTVPAGQNATCTRAAKIHRLCRLCSFGVTVDDPDNPPLGHDHQVNLVVAPTTSSRGYTNYKCTRCSDSYDADFVDPLPASETQAPAIETQPPVVESQAPSPDGEQVTPDA